MVTKVPPFLKTLYDIVNDPSCNQMIEWSQNGTAFVMRNTDKLCREVFPTKFRHSNFASFMRQLHNYGFRGRQLESNVYEYQHDGFIKGKPELMGIISRKDRPPKPEPIDRIEIELLRQENEGLKKDIAEIKQTQQQLLRLICRTYKSVDVRDTGSQQPDEPPLKRIRSTGSRTAAATTTTADPEIDGAMFSMSVMFPSLQNPLISLLTDESAPLALGDVGTPSQEDVASLLRALGAPSQEEVPFQQEHAALQSQNSIG